MSIESHLVSLRTYLEEISSQNKQIIAGQERTNQLLKESVNRTDGRGKELSDLAKKVAKEQGVDVFDVAVASGDDGLTTYAVKATAKPATVTAEKQLEAETGRDFVQTGKNPPTFVETDKPAAKKSAAKKAE